MAIDINHFKVSEKERIDLSEIDTDYDAGLEKEKSILSLSDLKAELFELQETLYADNRKSLLIIFQAMDAAGKDSAIKHVMSGLNPQGCQVYSFKQPTSEELDHDFLWRHYKALPERGRIGIHNRSHYENVLICKVHPEFASHESKLPLKNINEEFWHKRYMSIRNFEQHLSDNGTVIVKFFLHISPKEQKERLMARIDDPAKNWKFAAADLGERKLWKDYMQAYEDTFGETSSECSPWYVIPANKKWFARLAICQVLVETLKEMDLKYPTLSAEELSKLDENRNQLLEEK